MQIYRFKYIHHPSALQYNKTVGVRKKKINRRTPSFAPPPPISSTGDITSSNLTTDRRDLLGKPVTIF